MGDAPELCSPEGQWVDDAQRCENLGCVNATTCAVPTKVGVGDTFSCTLLSNGKIRCWGTGANGQLGAGDGVTYAIPPVEVASIGKATAFAVGSSHACAVDDSTHQVKCWGQNFAGQLGVDASTDKAFTPIVTMASPIGTPYIISGYNSVATSASQGCKGWGKNTGGVLANNSSPILYTPTQLGLSFYLGHRSIGDIVACSDINNKISCWGQNDYGQINNTSIGTAYPNAQIVFTPATPPTALSVGSVGACAVIGGKVTCWGTMAITSSNGTVSTYVTAPVEVAGITNAADISVGSQSICARTTTGKLMCWGRNSEGQLGIADSNGTSPAKVNTPTEVPGYSNVTDVSVSKSAHSCFIDSNKVYCMGGNLSGQLGYTGASSVKPVQVQF
ncbi:MAG: hypothetical protein U0165_15980 [Polyangiaceae bacterium]